MKIEIFSLLTPFPLSAPFTCGSWLHMTEASPSTSLGSLQRCPGPLTLVERPHLQYSGLTDPSKWILTAVLITFE